MKNLLKTSLVTLVMLLLLPVTAGAHGSSFNFKYIDGPNVVMITHNVHDPHAGVPLTYNIRLYNLTGQPVPFDKLETEFMLDGRSMRKQTFSPSSNDDVMLTYTYPKEGNYMLYTRFVSGDSQIIKGEFPLVVEKGLHADISSFFTLQTGVAFVVGAAASAALWQCKHILTWLKIQPRKKKS